MKKHLSETTAHQRLGYAVVVGVVAAFLPLPLAGITQGILAWCLGAGTYLVLSWWLAVTFDAARTRHRAQVQDQSSRVLVLVLVISAFANMAAIALMLQDVKDLPAWQHLAHVGLSMLALAISWQLIQTVFAFRYAHAYYRETVNAQTHGAGLQFPGNEPPDYFDFLYYAYVVGMTSQVSDVVVTSRRMRRLTLVHSVTAFAFNMLVLALSINLVAGAIQ
jgi:uncharacterized membrane protein